MPDPLEICFRATGGTESNEIALLLARAYTHKKKVISFETEYHGGTFGSLSLSSSVHVKNTFGPMLPDFVQLPMPACFYGPCDTIENCQHRCFKYIDQALATGDVAAVITEAVATNPGVYMPSTHFFRLLRRKCTEAHALLIVDEIGTGFGRTGRMFAFEHFGLVPDVVTLAKALSGGYAPIGATVTTREIASSAKGTLDSPTFGWTPLACAATLANIQIIEKEDLCQRAGEMGNYIKDRLVHLLGTHPFVSGIRGVGMELAIDVVGPNGQKSYESALQVVRKCEECGLIVELTGSACAVLLMPPLVIKKTHVDAGLAIVVEAFNSLSG